MTDQNVKKRVFLVTGATGAIGKAIAKQLAKIPGSEVVLVCRNQQKAELAIKEITDSTENAKIRFELADLSRYDEIHGLAERWNGPLHVLN